MNLRQKELLRLGISKERLLKRELEKAYKKAGKDIERRIKRLTAEYEATGLEGKVYQIQFQKALKIQIDQALAGLRSGVYRTIDDYRKDRYRDGYLGAMYDMQGQGVPLIIPIDPAMMEKAVVLDSKLSKKLYKRLGINIQRLKKTVRDEISRNLAAGKMYDFVAAGIDLKMHTGRYRAMRIARTEGQRIANEAACHAQERAKERGADIVKQWCAILDGRTRPSHALLNGQIREIGEPFQIDGHKAMYPGGFGIPSEDINCRCALLQRARWALEGEGDGFIKAKNFPEFEAEYEKKTKK